MKKKIILGVTGGIAAYKSCELVRLMKKAGHNVVVVMTKSAQDFISPHTFQSLSGNPVFYGGGEYQEGRGMDHIDLTRHADLILIAPATANTIAKIAHGIADTILSNLILARNCPLAVAPAMNVEMWNNPATQRNIEIIQQDGVYLFGPASGEQACGEFGLGRMIEPIDLIDVIDVVWMKPVLKGKKILITTGGTREMIDPVRCITNLSTGRMGMSLARACRNAGAEVSLICASVSVPVIAGLKEVTYVTSTEEMYHAVHEKIHNVDVFIPVAAVSDYRVTEISDKKIKKNVDDDGWSLQLVETTDVLSSVARLPNAPFCIGFAAESNDLIDHAKKKRIKKGIPLLVANLISDGMGTETNQVTVISEYDTITLPKQNKNDVAQSLVSIFAEYINK